MTIQDNPALYVASVTGALKALPDGGFEGLLIRFSDPDQPDLTNDHFTKSTQLFKEVGDTLPILYEHGLDKTIKTRLLGKAVITDIDDVGVWIKGQLKVSDDYEKAIYNHLIKTGKAGLSSGAAGHLVSRKKSAGKSVKEITEWGLAEASITPKPVEPLTRGLSIKSLQDYSDEREEVDWLKCTCGGGDISSDEEEVKTIRKDGSKFSVYSEDGEKLGTHDTEADAQAQLAAIEANKDKVKKAIPGSTQATPNKAHTFQPKDGDDNVCAVCGKAEDDPLHDAADDDEPAMVAHPDKMELGGKSLLGDKLDAIQPSIWTLRDALNEVSRDIATLYRLRNVTGDSFDLEEKVTEAVTEYAARLIPLMVNQIQKFDEDAAKPGSGSAVGVGGSEPVFYLRSLPAESLHQFVKSQPVPGETLEQHSARAVSAVEEYASLSEGVVKSLELLTSRVNNKIEFRRSDAAHTGHYLGAPGQRKLAVITEAVRGNADRLKSLAATLEALQAAAVKAAPAPAPSAETAGAGKEPAGGLSYEQMQMQMTLAVTEVEMAEV
jgi:hypothetical protein